MMRREFELLINAFMCYLIICSGILFHLGYQKFFMNIEKTDYGGMTWKDRSFMDI